MIPALFDAGSRSLAAFVVVGIAFGLLTGFALFSPTIPRDRRAFVVAPALLLPAIAVLLILVCGVRVDYPTSAEARAERGIADREEVRLAIEARIRRDRYDFARWEARVP